MKFYAFKLTRYPLLSVLFTSRAQVRAHRHIALSCYSQPIPHMALPKEEERRSHDCEKWVAILRGFYT